MRNWKFVNLSIVTNNLDNKRIPLNSKQRSEKESNPIYPYIGANKIMTYVDEYIFDGKILCVAEDGGSWGHNETCAVIYNEKVWVNNHAHVLTAKESLVLEYLKYFLNYSDLNLHINGATRGKLTKSALNSIQIPLPPLETQKKIAAILDAADAYRQKTKALIAKYDELTQSLFLDMFGDPVRNEKGLPTLALGELADFFSGKAWKKAELGEKGYKLVRISNLHKPNFPYWYYDGALNEKLKVEDGDLLFSWAGVQASIDAYIYRGDVAMINQHIYNIKPKDERVSKIYLFNLLQLHLEDLRGSLGGGVGQFHLKKSDITSIKVLIPSKDEMKRYMNSLESINKQKAQSQQSLEKAEELFNSLLQRAFKGEL